jgi:hypothetical protein
MVGDLEGASRDSGVADRVELSGAGGARLRTRPARRLTAGLGAPRCFGHAEHGGQHFLWLEDLGSDAIRWRLDDYGKAARALGRFNGAYLIGRSLPVAGWLSQQWLRSWLAEGAGAMRELPRFRRHPLVQRVYPREVLDRLLLLWARRDELLDGLDRMPQVLGHNDAFRRNLFLRSERLLAVDWAFLGPEPVGAELAPLVTASVAFLGVARDSWRDLEQTAVEAYLHGLQDVGWRGAPDFPRFGFAASSALRYGPGCVRLVLPALLDDTLQRGVELVLGIRFHQVLELWAAVCLDNARLADDAFTLLATIDV